MPSHPIYLRRSRQVWGSVADALSALITEQAQEEAQAQHTHGFARTIKCNWKHWKNLRKVKETAGKQLRTDAC